MFGEAERTCASSIHSCSECFGAAVLVCVGGASADWPSVRSLCCWLLPPTGAFVKRTLSTDRRVSATVCDDDDDDDDDVSLSSLR